MRTLVIYFAIYVISSSVPGDVQADGRVGET